MNNVNNSYSVSSNNNIHNNSNNQRLSSDTTNSETNNSSCIRVTTNTEPIVNVDKCDTDNVADELATKQTIDDTSMTSSTTHCVGVERDSECVKNSMPTNQIDDRDITDTSSATTAASAAAGAVVAANDDNVTADEQQQQSPLNDGSASVSSENARTHSDGMNNGPANNLYL